VGEFVEVFKAEAGKLKADQSRHVAWLPQGTIYPDVINPALPVLRSRSPSRATT